VDDVAARIGGDEFIVLATGIDATSALRLGEHLLHDVSQPIALADGTRVSVGLSIGISIVSGANRSPQSALDSADAALYRAKARGGRCCAVAGGGRRERKREHARRRTRPGLKRPGPAPLPDDILRASLHKSYQIT
jgi:GGDEF domain-containing protein